MAKKDKGSFAPPALGGISLLVVFAVLCLTVFALLSLSTVRADERLSDASAQAVKNYYAADCKAQELLRRSGLTVVSVAIRYPFRIPKSFKWRWRSGPRTIIPSSAGRQCPLGSGGWMRVWTFGTAKHFFKREQRYFLERRNLIWHNFWII